MSQSKLSQLQQFTTVVADSGDFEIIARLKPVDATTNPSLLYKSIALPYYAETLAQLRSRYPGASKQAALQYAVAVGTELLSLIPGRISTEVDVRLSFDEEATYANAMQIIEAYAAAGIDQQRVLIKIAATWQGIAAAARLEKIGVQTNLTLLFSFAQAAACADAGVFLISPFVGRIYDWYCKTEQRDYIGAEDPGVQSVARIYRYYKQNNYPTIVMGASFRNLSQIEQLCGCDRLTISPDLIDQLAQQQGLLPRQLSPEQAGEPLCNLNAADFYWQHNADAMAVEKLAEGLRLFAQDQEKLEQLFV